MEDVQFTSEQQAFIDALVGKTRIEAREKAQTAATAQVAKEKADAEQAALVAQQQWQTLAEQHSARVKELEPLVKQVEGYEELVKGMLKSAVEQHGDAAKTAVNALPKSMTATEKLNWLNANQGLFQSTGGGLGTPARPAKASTNAKAEPRRVTGL